MLLLFKSLSRSHILVQSFLESIATDKKSRCKPDKIWRLTITGFAGRFFRISHRFRLLKTLWKSQFNEHLEVLEHEFVPLKGASVFTQLFGPRVFVWMSGLSKNSRINVSICTELPPPTLFYGVISFIVREHLNRFFLCSSGKNPPDKSEFL